MEINVTVKEMLEYKKNGKVLAEKLVEESGLKEDVLLNEELEKYLEKIDELSPKMTTKLKKDDLYPLYKEFVFAISDIKFIIYNKDLVKEYLQNTEN